MENLSEAVLRLQQIDRLARQSIARQHKQIPEKYSRIQATLKLLNNLISTFNRKANRYENDLVTRSHIQQLTQQIVFHQQRLAECTNLSQKLTLKIEARKAEIKQSQEQVTGLRADIVVIKTQNVKKIMKIEQMQRAEARRWQHQAQQQHKMSWKMKTEYSRSFHKTTDWEHLKPTEIQDLQSQKQELVAKINQKLNQIRQFEQTVAQVFSQIRAKLWKGEKKANSNGLHGSLMFKLISNCKDTSVKPPPPGKLMMYDILRNKYKRHQQNKGKVQVSWEQFQNYSPLQILGIIQMRGGIDKLKEEIINYQKSQKDNKNYKIQKQNRIEDSVQSLK